MERDLLGFAAGFVIATITSPVGVSGAVFLLPVQLSMFGVPNPQVTPTNLLYNVLAGPGALFRYARQGQLRGPLARYLVGGSAPGVIIGAVLRVYVADDPTVFKLVAAAVLAPTGLLILLSTPSSGTRLVGAPLSPRSITVAAFVVGIAGGIYGIGGGSILGPVLVGSGMAISRVAPGHSPAPLSRPSWGWSPSQFYKRTRRGPSLPTGHSASPAGWVGCVVATSARPCNPGCPRSRSARCSVSWPSASLWSTPSRLLPERTHMPRSARADADDRDVVALETSTVLAIGQSRDSRKLVVQPD